MKLSIFQTLEKLGLASKENQILFNKKTRDVNDLKVWKDKVSGVIYIDEFYTGEQTYINGSYRNDEVVDLNIEKPDFENLMDAQRRFKSNLNLVVGKRVADFGCGNGDYLKLIKPYCIEVFGIELQKNYLEYLNKIGISCTNDLTNISNKSFDVLVSFHVIEHLPNPLETLTELINKVVTGGYIIIEVPHANDFLLSTIFCEEFKQFTLWSQHLILHTRESLRKILNYVGLKNIQIQGVQRYPLSNHLNWLMNGKPDGHKSQLSVIDSDALLNAYNDSLLKIDATDTLIAIAKV